MKRNTGLKWVKPRRGSTKVWKLELNLHIKTNTGHCFCFQHSNFNFAHHNSGINWDFTISWNFLLKENVNFSFYGVLYVAGVDFIRLLAMSFLRFISQNNAPPPPQIWIDNTEMDPRKDSRHLLSSAEGNVLCSHIGLLYTSQNTGSAVHKYSTE